MALAECLLIILTVIMSHTIKGHEDGRKVAVKVPWQLFGTRGNPLLWDRASACIEVSEQGDATRCLQAWIED